MKFYIRRHWSGGWCIHYRYNDQPQLNYFLGFARTWELAGKSASRLYALETDT